MFRFIAKRQSHTVFENIVFTRICSFDFIHFFFFFGTFRGQNVLFLFKTIGICLFINNIVRFVKRYIILKCVIVVLRSIIERYLPWNFINPLSAFRKS